MLRLVLVFSYDTPDGALMTPSGWANSYIPGVALLAGIAALTVIIAGIQHILKRKRTRDRFASFGSAQGPSASCGRYWAWWRVSI